MSQMRVFKSKLILLSASVQAVTWASPVREDVQLRILDYKITTISSHLSPPTLVSAVIHSGDGRYIVTTQRFHWNSESREGRVIVRQSGGADNGDVYITHWLCTARSLRWPNNNGRECCRGVNWWRIIFQSNIILLSSFPAHHLLYQDYKLSHDVVTAPI